MTGAAGLVGSHLCEQLIGEGHRVVGVDNFNDYYDPAQKRSNVVGLIESDRFTLSEADIQDADAMLALCEAHRPNAIAHLAAMANVRYSIGRAPLYTSVNIVGSINLLEAARRCDIRRFVFASTSSAYGNTQTIPFSESDNADRPLAPYPASKRALEILGYTYHNLHGIDFTALRFFSVYGPRARPDMMPYMVTDRIARGQTIQLFDAGELWRDWTYVADIAAGTRLALDPPSPLGYAILNLGRGEPVRMADFVATLEALLGREAILETPPAPASEPKRTHADISAARAALGYDPKTSIDEGLSNLVAWYRARAAQ